MPKLTASPLLKPEIMFSFGPPLCSEKGRGASGICT